MSAAAVQQGGAQAPSFNPHGAFKQFLAIPKGLYARTDIDPLAKLIYARMASFKDGCFMKRETLAEELGVSVTTVMRALASLVEHGYIRRKTVAGKVSITEFLSHPDLDSDLKTGTISTVQECTDETLNGADAHRLRCKSEPTPVQICTAAYKDEEIDLGNRSRKGEANPTHVESRSPEPEAPSPKKSEPKPIPKPSAPSPPKPTCRCGGKEGWFVDRVDGFEVAFTCTCSAADGKQSIVDRLNRGVSKLRGETNTAPKPLGMVRAGVALCARA